MTRVREVVAIALIATGLTACSSGSSRGAATVSGVVGSAHECGLEAFAKAKKPVEVTFWHAMLLSNADWLVQATAAFNRSQRDVHVTLVQIPSYQDLSGKYLAGFSTHDLPTLFHGEDTTVQRLLDSQSTVPMQACVDADHYSLSDFLPRATAFYSFNKVLLAMPWNVSNVVLWYNRTAFQKAGLDPETPPRTYDEITAYSQKTVQSRAAAHGIALRVEPYVFEGLNAKADATYVNHGNGRTGRATSVTLKTPAALRIWTWWKRMVSGGLALNTGAGNVDHLLAVGTGNAAMTIESSSALGPAFQVLASGLFAGVRIGIAPLPTFGPSGGVPVGDGSLWITKASPPAKRAAAWQFVKYLSSPQQQASLAAEGGYVPVRASAVNVPVLSRRWASAPVFKVAYDQLLSGPTDVATVGPLIGDYAGVRDTVKDGLFKMLTSDISPEAALDATQRDADAVIKNYNARLGM